MKEFSFARLSLGHPVKSLLVFVLVFAAAPAWACSVPVFRYALEHWRSDPYQVIFFHRGKLTPEQEAQLTQLRESGKEGKLSANLEVIPVDLDEASPDDPRTKDDLALWESLPADKTLPWIVVQYPLTFPSPKTILSGPPTKETINQLVDSPKRKEIAKRILKGETAVWLFLESGNKEKDDQAYERLAEELKKCENELQLPEPDPQDVADGLISVEQASLKIQFSILRLSKTDAAEKPFIDMLLESEEDLRDPQFAGQPMVFPIFGRGRALYAIIGDGIQRSVIFDASRFLVGPCSCQVKQQNPGTDLLMAINWDQAVTPQIPVDTSLPPLPIIPTVSEPDNDPNKKEEINATNPQDKTANKTEASPKSETKPAPTESNPPNTAALTEKALPEEDSSAQEVAEGVMGTTFIFAGVAVVGIVLASFFFLKPSN